jgi:hypothetical protein
LLTFLLHLQHKEADCLEEENRLRKNKINKNQIPKFKFLTCSSSSSSKYATRVTSLIPSASIKIQ